MLELQGKYAGCKIFTDEVEQSAMSQIYDLMNCPISEGAQIRIMPDCHAGKGCVIGFTASVTDKVCPGLIGVDIGCGVSCVSLGQDEIDFRALDLFIRDKVPNGCNVNESLRNGVASKDLQAEVSRICKTMEFDEHRVLCALGSLGGGNHFIEVAKGQNDTYLLIHSGSRNFGLKIAMFHQAIAKAQNPFGDLSFLTGSEKDAYVRDMIVAQGYAERNRQLMCDKIIDFLNAPIEGSFESVHNFIDFKTKIIRKGAIGASAGQKVIVPLNMRDGSILGVGKGNADWNFSAPHGAGRKMSRSKAKKEVSLEEFRTSMAGIYSSCVNQSTLDESPMAYKDSDTIIAALGETVEITDIIKPIYNFKASE